MFHNVAFSAPRGQVSVLIAPSGAGKSTLLRCLNRLHEPTSGTVYLDEQDITSLDPQILRQRVGLIGQIPIMLPGSVADNLLYRLPAGADERVDGALEDAGLSARFRNRRAQDLSGGERARVALARALIRDPEMLLLDEPTAALDAMTADRIAETLRRLAGEHYGVVLATHDMPFAEAVANQVISLTPNGVKIQQSSAPSQRSP